MTEAVQFSLHTAKKPLFALFLDAKSAFDSVLRKILINKLYFCGTTDQSLILINNRLKSRTTYVEWDKEMMGPISDEQGVEQGGANSGDYYKIFGKEQLSTAQASDLGVPLRSKTISSVGQADDTLLLSNCLHSLQNLLKLSLDFCKRHEIQLCVEKTKLLAVSTQCMATSVEYSKLTSPVHINGTKLPFSTTVEHVGIVRHESSNLAHIMSRIKAHQKALGSVLHTGSARHHRGNPAGSMRIEKLYALPKLFSGLGSLVLLKTEIDMIDFHIKETHEKLMRLHPRTPQCVVSFLGGCLPGTALIHQKMLSIFGMICVLKSSVLHQHALDVLVVSKQSSRSWFIKIRELCLQYGLPHPLSLLKSDLSKDQLKIMVRKQIINYWEMKLRSDAEPLLSLQYFHPEYMSLCRPHPIWTTAGANPYQVAMSTVQATMLSGRYRTELLCSNWVPTNNGCCQTPSCRDHLISENIQHILVFCTALDSTRENLKQFTIKIIEEQPIFVRELVEQFCDPHHLQFVQFLLDCSSIPEVIQACQLHGAALLCPLFRIARTWCYSIHKARLKILGRWSNNW